MYCSNCKAQLPEDAKFCTNCGKVLYQKPVVNAQPEFFRADNAVNTLKTKKKKTKMILIISAGLLVIACAILIPVYLEGVRAAQYKDAFELIDSGDLPEAKQEFIELGAYKDSEEMAQTCQSMMDYASATALMDSGDYDAAKQAFDLLGTYEQSESLSIECQNIIDYNAAVALMEAGSTEDARNAFLALGSFSDSAAQAQECQNRLDYTAATELMSGGQLEAAVAAFSELGSYQDSAQQAGECQNRIDYASADEAYNAGKFYTAYIMFSDLSGFQDADARAQSCIQAIPENGELYRSTEYESKKCSITFKTPDDGYYTFLRIFDNEQDVLVSTVFIAPGTKTRVKLPKGDYYLNVAYGHEWYGQDERFGDEGIYRDRLSFEDDGAVTDIMELRSGYTYTLTVG